MDTDLFKVYTLKFLFGRYLFFTIGIGLHMTWEAKLMIYTI